MARMLKLLTVNAPFLTSFRFTAFLLFACQSRLCHLALAASIRERQSNTAVCRQSAVNLNCHFPKLKTFQGLNWPLTTAAIFLYWSLRATSMHVGLWGLQPEAEVMTGSKCLCREKLVRLEGQREMRRDGKKDPAEGGLHPADDTIRTEGDRAAWGQLADEIEPKPTVSALPYVLHLLPAE